VELVLRELAKQVKAKNTTPQVTITETSELVKKALDLQMRCEEVANSPSSEATLAKMKAIDAEAAELLTKVNYNWLTQREQNLSEFRKIAARLRDNLNNAGPGDAKPILQATKDMTDLVDLHNLMRRDVPAYPDLPDTPIMNAKTAFEAIANTNTTYKTDWSQIIETIQAAFDLKVVELFSQRPGQNMGVQPRPSSLRRPRFRNAS
jgi:hypothetical protein